MSEPKPASDERLNVLLLCTGNSCRSQMAEGWARALRPDSVRTYSAGVEPHGMNPRAIKVMAEAGVDISGHHSKHVDELKDIPFDYVITVCDHAHETCPLFPGKTKVLHVGFDDPPRWRERLKPRRRHCYIIAACGIKSVTSSKNSTSICRPKAVKVTSTWMSP